MNKIACLCVAFASVTSAWSQVAPSASGGGSRDESMSTPAPVNGEGYPAGTSSEARSNYLAGGFVFTGAYTDNLLLSETNEPVADENYSFSPTITFDRRTARQDESIQYNAGFNLYQK